MTKLKIDTLFLNEKIKEASIDTNITFKNDFTKEDILKDGNDMVDNLDDIQDQFLYLSRGCYNRFIGGHYLQDGNKRMFHILMTHLLETIEIEDIQ